MLGIRNVAAAVALAVTLGLVPAAAAKKPTGPLTLEVEGKPLAPGATLEATSSTFVLKNSTFRVHCTESSLAVSLKSNEGSKAIGASIAGATFRGGATIDPEACESGPEWVLTWDPTSSASLEFFVRGEARIDGAKLKMVPAENVGTRHEPGCHLASKNLKGTFKLGEAPQPLVLKFQATKFKLEPEQGEICEKKRGKGHEPLLSGEFAFASEGHTVEVVS